MKKYTKPFIREYQISCLFHLLVDSPKDKSLTNKDGLVHNNSGSNLHQLSKDVSFDVVEEENIWEDE